MASHSNNRDPATGMPMAEKLRTYGMGFLVGGVLSSLLFVSRCQMKARERAIEEQQRQQHNAAHPGPGLPTGPQ